MSRSMLSHLECPKCKQVFEYSQPRNLCSCGSPLLARYNLEKARETFNRDALKGRISSMWRYEEVLPGALPGARGFSRAFEPVSLGEGMTPLVPAPRLGETVGLRHLYIKDESQNPTNSFKARGLSAAVSMAKAVGVTTIALPTAGNAGGAAAAYAAHAGLGCVIAMPKDTPSAIVLECRAFGADVHLMDGLISDCGAFIAKEAARAGWFEVSTLKEPYRIEGKKTMGYELWEELDGELPDVIVYPTGGGVGLIGMWKAFEELGEMGLVGPKRPRMISAQAAGCAPIVRAFDKHASVSEKWDNASTVASGLRVPKALGDFLILEDIYASHGEAVAATDKESMDACKEIARLEGMLAAPESGAGMAAIQKLVAAGKIGADETVVLFSTGGGYKYMEAWNAAIGV